MNRTDRLYALSEELRRVGAAGTTAARLAQHFEVSSRTIKRDISALQQIGLPIWGESGPGGGYVIAGTASLPPVNFTISQAIAAAAALAAMPDGSPFGTDARAAAGKIRDALSPSDALKSSETARRLWVHTKTHTGAASRSVRAIEQSLLQSNVVLLTYRAADGTTTRRAVEPTILALTEGHWYLVAHCRLVDDLRWFRFDRIITADLTREPYTPRPVADIGTAPEGAHHVDTSEEGPIHDVNGR